jgi:hypothetical protein
MSNTQTVPTSTPPAPPPPPRTRWGALLPGILVLLFGVGFLLNNFGALQFNVDCFWPLVVIAYGVVRITQRNIPDFIWGGAFCVFGVAMIFDCMGLFHVHFWQLWPIFVIAFGLILLWGTLVPGACACGPFGRTQFWRGRLTLPFTQQASTVGDDWVELNAVFAEAKRRVLSSSFRGATANSAFGACKLDLRSMPTPAEPVIIDANTIFGAVEVYVPPTWTVELRGSALFGAYQDETTHVTGPDGLRGHLIVRGSALFGGVMVKN